ncbi:MAG: hypothetical protein R3E84_08030 [Pseudomonadales bacterium]
MTDPRVADTDGDGVGDLQEVEQNLDPLTPRAQRWSALCFEKA